VIYNLFSFLIHRPVCAETGEQKKKFFQAARLVVAFKGDIAKGKNVVHKDKDGNITRSAPIAFAIKSQPLDLSEKSSGSYGFAPKGAPNALQAQLEQIAASRSQDGADTAEAVELGSSKRLSGKDGFFSVMTDTFDDSPVQSMASSPVQSAAAAGAAHAGLVMGAQPNAVPSAAVSARGAASHPRVVVNPDTGRRSLDGTQKRSADDKHISSSGGSRKQSLFDFKPPDDVVVPSRNKASKFITKLKERIGKDQAQKVEQLVEENDDESVVSSYFDHNAAPIFVEREKVEKHVLHSKRFEKSEAKEYKSRYSRSGEEGDFESDTDDEEGWQSGRQDSGGDGTHSHPVILGADGRVLSRKEQREMIESGELIERIEINEAGEEVTYVTGPNGESVSMRVTSAKSSKSGKIKKVKPLFDLEKFVDGVSHTEKQWMEGLDQIAINKITEGMNVSLPSLIFCILFSVLFFWLMLLICSSIFLYFEVAVRPWEKRFGDQQEEPRLFPQSDREISDREN